MAAEIRAFNATNPIWRSLFCFAWRKGLEWRRSCCLDDARGINSRLLEAFQKANPILFSSEIEVLKEYLIKIADKRIDTDSARSRVAQSQYKNSASDWRSVSWDSSAATQIKDALSTLLDHLTSADFEGAEVHAEIQMLRRQMERMIPVSTFPEEIRQEKYWARPETITKPERTLPSRIEEVRHWRVKLSNSSHTLPKISTPVFRRLVIKSKTAPQPTVYTSRQHKTAPTPIWAFVRNSACFLVLVTVACFFVFTSSSHTPALQPVPETSSLIAGETDSSRLTAAPVDAIKSVLGIWVQSMQSGDLDAQLNCYAPIVDQYFRSTNVDEPTRRNWKAEWMAKWATTRFDLSNVTFRELEPERFQVEFIKQWDATGSSHFTGASQNTLIFKRVNDAWKTVDEQESAVYRISNVDTPMKVADTADDPVNRLNKTSTGTGVPGVQEMVSSKNDNDIGGTRQSQ